MQRSKLPWQPKWKDVKNLVLKRASLFVATVSYDCKNVCSLELSQLNGLSQWSQWMSAFYAIKLFTAVKLRNKLACLTPCFTVATKLNILPFSITTFSIMTLSITIKNRDAQHNGTQYCYAECHAKCHLCWVSQISPLCWVSLYWMSLCWVSWRRFTWVGFRLIRKH